jgi:hypothetical protein
MEGWRGREGCLMRRGVCVGGGEGRGGVSEERNAVAKEERRREGWGV